MNEIAILTYILALYPSYYIYFSEIQSISTSFHVFICAHLFLKSHSRLPFQSKNHMRAQIFSLVSAHTACICILAGMKVGFQNTLS